MRLNEGKLGAQESVSIAAAAITACSVFLLDSSKAYSQGDSAFISLPLGIGISTAVFMLMWCAMKRLGAHSLNELMDMCVGRGAGKILSLLATFIFVLYAYRLMARFCIMIHGRVFTTAQYENVALWMVVPVAYAAIKGFECIGRLAKAFAALIGVLMLVSLAFMLPSYDISRLAPFIGDISKLMTDTVSRSADSLGAFLGLLCAAASLQGADNVKKSGLISAAIAFVLVLIIQLAIGATFTYADLSEMSMPIYIMKMVVLRESYLFRLDQLNLFSYMIIAMIAAAYFIYCASLTLTRCVRGSDIRPTVVGISALLLAALRVDHRFEAGIIQRSIDFLYDNAYFAAIPFVVAAVAGLIHARRGKGYEANN